MTITEVSRAIERSKRTQSRSIFQTRKGKVEVWAEPRNNDNWSMCAKVGNIPICTDTIEKFIYQIFKAFQS